MFQSEKPRYDEAGKRIIEKAGEGDLAQQKDESRPTSPPTLQDPYNDGLGLENPF